MLVTRREPLPPPPVAVLRPAALVWKAVAAGPGLFTAAQFVALALSFVGGAFMVRVAEPAAVASYMLFVQGALVLTPLMEMGLGPAAVRFAPLARGRGGTATTALLRRRLLAILLSGWFVIALPMAAFWPTITRWLDAPELSAAAAAALATAGLLSFNAVSDAYLRAFRYFEASAAIGDVAPRVLMAVAFALFFTLQLDATWVALAAIFFGAQLCASLAYAAALWTTTAAETSEARDATPPPAFPAVAGAAVTMGFRASVGIVLGTSALWVLSWARPHEEVAVYGVMLGLGQLVGLTVTVAARLVPQEFAVLHADGRLEDLERLTRTTATAVGLVTLAAFVALALGGRFLISVAYGETYVSGWSALLVLTLGTFLDAAAGLAGCLLQSTGHHVALLRLTIAAAIVNLALSLLLAPAFGAVGVAAATTVTIIVFDTALVLTARRLVGVTTVAYLRPSRWLAAVTSVFGALVSRDLRGLEAPSVYGKSA